MSGDNERHLDTLHDEIFYTLKKQDMLPRSHSKGISPGWLTLDYGDVIVHIFAEAEREYYRLEELWGGATPVVRIQ